MPKLKSAPNPVFESLTRSGFPFQTAVRHVISSSPKRWEIHTSEYPWLGSDNEEYFLDLIATKKEFALTIECKKTRSEILTFLLPLGHSHTGDIPDFRCLRAESFTVTKRDEYLFCETWSLWPPSPRSEFCVVGTSASGRDQRLLERDASLVVCATDALAHDVQRHKTLGKGPPYLFVPVIVTNAQIYTARYEPPEVSLETGEFGKVPKDIKPTPWIRFHKAFATAGRRDLGSRSVFVVNAMSFGQFLEILELAPDAKKGSLSVLVPWQATA
jgi:hypothetical protein